MSNTGTGFIDTNVDERTSVPPFMGPQVDQNSFRYQPSNQTGADFKNQSWGTSIAEFETSSESENVATQIVEVRQEERMFGEVSEVSEEYSLVIFHSNGENIERLIRTDRLKAKGANFEGARIMMVVQELNDKVVSWVENISSISPPKWREAIENHDLTFFEKLKKAGKKKPTY